jgi:hypothetical protein
MQAIQTKYLPMTNTRGSRVKARCGAGTVTVNWDYALSVQENHLLACKTLLAKVGWTDGAYYSPMVGGTFDECMCWVFTGALSPRTA